MLTASSSSSALQPWLDPGLLKQMSPAPSILDIRQLFLQPSFLASSSTPSIHLHFGWSSPRWPPWFDKQWWVICNIASARVSPALLYVPVRRCSHFSTRVLLAATTLRQPFLATSFVKSLIEPAGGSRDIFWRRKRADTFVVVPTIRRIFLHGLCS